MTNSTNNYASAAGDDDLEQMTPNQRRALNKALSALETMAALWASEIRLTDLSKRIADVPDASERAKRIAAFVEQGFIEGAYRHYLDHKDQIEALATVAPAVDAQPAWISVDERLPENDQVVAFVVMADQESPNWYLNGHVLGGTYHENWGFSTPGVGHRASHWMPLPEAPAALSQ
ncbi:DUF551 domain-containing protein [Paraburkholderia caledonica]|uniref:DUF551 domain-containing protein n=1 Tax=Paraburkholderia caledonica TaxID=134536 RepID=UPI000B4041D1|nr:DUF551 domain-containing protein [Paraburkholderia caledonica]